MYWYSRVVEAVQKEYQYLLGKWPTLDSEHDPPHATRQNLFRVYEQPPHVVHETDKDQKLPHHAYPIHAQDKLERQRESGHASEQDYVRYHLPNG